MIVKLQKLLFRYIQVNSLVGITSDKPLVDADLITDLDFDLFIGKMGTAL